MSLTSEDRGAVGGAAGLAVAQLQAPRLQSGGVGYATWHPSMDAFLQRNGADSIHKKPLTQTEWVRRVRNVDSWAAAELDAACALALASADDDLAEKVEPSEEKATVAVTQEMKEARRLVTTMVDRSRKVYGLIYSALPEELRAQTAHLPQGWAYGLWYWLATKFQSTEQDRVGEMLAQWTHLRQEDSESFDAYRARVNHLQSLLTQAKERQSARMYAYTLLDKLQPRYKQAVLALKASDKLKQADSIDWDTVTAFINSHEREESRIDGEVANGDAKAMAAMSGTSWSQRMQLAKQAKQKGGQAASASAPARQGAERAPRTMDDVQCFGCKQFGHMKRNCPKAEQRSRSSTQGQRQSASKSSDSSQHRPDAARQQAKAAMGKRQNRYESLSDRSDSDADSENSDSEGTPAASGHKKHSAKYAAVVDQVPRENASAMAARRFKVKHASAVAATQQPQQVKAAHQLPCCKADRSLSGNAWGVDTMASLSLSGNKALFVDLKECTPVPVEVADGSIITASQRGTVYLRVVSMKGRQVCIPIQDVYYHESVPVNLLGWNSLKVLGWKLYSDRSVSYLTTPGKVKLKLSTKGRVCVLKSAHAQAASSSESCTERACSIAPFVPTPTTIKFVRLHERLCHIGFDVMMELVKAKAVEGLPAEKLTTTEFHHVKQIVHECRSCLEGKGHRVAFGHRGVEKGEKPGEVLHMDTFSITVSKERKLYKHCLVATTALGSWLWARPMNTKDEGAQHAIDIIKNAQTQLGCKVKRVYCDGGTEFITSRLKRHCQQEGMELHWPAAGAEQLRGVAERLVRTVKEMVRSTMQHAGLHIDQWERAVEHAVYVWNRTHVCRSTGKTPYQIMFGAERKPSVKHLGVFGCNVFVWIPKSERSTFAAKVEPGVYLGHHSEQNCARVLLLRTGKMKKTRDVTFRQDSFTHLLAVRSAQGHLDHPALLRILKADQPEMFEPSSNSWSDVDEAIHQSVAAGALDEAVPQGGLQAAAPPAAEGKEAEELAEAVSDEEYAVERILKDRVNRQTGIKEYFVRWVGYPKSAASWEPALTIDHDVPDRVREYEDLQQALRRSTRSSKKEEASRAVTAAAAVDIDDGNNDDGDDEPQSSERAHMVMSALTAIQSPEERPARAELLMAVKAGLARVERSTPSTYKEAMSSGDSIKWRSAMQKEMDSCKQQDVWKLVKRSELKRGANVLPCKWVYRIKTDSNGTIIEHKARITPKGFRQRAGVDYHEVFAGTGKYKTMRVGLSLAAKLDHELEQMDVPAAFLRAELKEDVYMELPEGFRDGHEGMVCKLQKALYGLKQAPREWSLTLNSFLTGELGLRPTVSDPCLLFKRSRTGRLILFFEFVDDFQGSFHREDRAEWNEIKAALKRRFNTKDMGESTWILGMRITRDRKARTITLDQELYVSKALEKFGFEQCRTAETPEAVGAAHQELNEHQKQPADAQRYMEIVGTLMYAAISTRPDIAHATHYLASHMREPLEFHMTAAERVLRYLAGTLGAGLIFGSRNGGIVADSRGHGKWQTDVCAWADADWANNREDRKSITGWVAKLNGDPVSWSSKKQRIVAQSTCEAELYAEAAAIQEVLWLRGLLVELGLHVQMGSLVHGDNQSTIAVSKNGVRSERTKHIDVKYHFVTETVTSGVVQLKWVPTAEQQADIFTKALPAPAFVKLRNLLMRC